MRTGVADFNKRFLSFLSSRRLIEEFTDRSILPRGAAVSAGDISDFLSNPARFDAVLYHMGNHYRYHRRIYEAILKAPGFVLLHDCILSHFFAKYYLERGDFEIFRKVLAASVPGKSGEAYAAFFGEESGLYRFPMAGAIARASRGTVVMSEYGKGILERESPQTAALRLRFPYLDKTRRGDVDAFRKKRGISPDWFIVTSIGHITPAKRIDIALAAFREFHVQFPKSLFLIAGEHSAYAPAQLSAQETMGVRYLGYLERAELDSLMEISDFCINLRYPSHGEMSSALIDMLGRGKVTAVSNHAQFAEFPDNVCVKIEAGPDEKEELARALLSIARDGRRQKSIEEAAGAYIAKMHDPCAAAEALVEFMNKHAGAQPLLSPQDSRVFLQNDPFPARQGQALRYNLRRAAHYAREQGMARLVEEGYRRVVSKRN
jgi:glycosyltransferase involved in cell wall biosynthesis